MRVITTDSSRLRTRMAKNVRYFFRGIAVGRGSAKIKVAGVASK